MLEAETSSALQEEKRVEVVTRGDASHIGSFSKLIRLEGGACLRLGIPTRLRHNRPHRLHPGIAVRNRFRRPTQTPRRARGGRTAVRDVLYRVAVSASGYG
jgi:hypothetical protein